MADEKKTKKTKNPPKQPHPVPLRKHLLPRLPHQLRLQRKHLQLQLLRPNPHPHPSNHHRHKHSQLRRAALAAPLLTHRMLLMTYSVWRRRPRRLRNCMPLK